MRTLLVNWVFQKPVGHVIEALRIAQHFLAADPSLAISLLLNDQAPLELASCVPKISAVYGVNVERAGHSGGFPVELPREWDYVFTDPRANKPRNWHSLNRFHDEFRKWIRAHATNYGPNRTEMPARRIVPLRLSLPAEVEIRASSLLSTKAWPRLSVLLGAGSHLRAPSMGFWATLFHRLFECYPNLEIVLLGSFESKRTSTKGVSQADVAALCNRFPGIHNAFDAGILLQLALAKRCQAHVSPHTGMSFAVQAVGVPWLALSGQEWHEFLLNGVPLISVFPECPLYPCHREIYPECTARRERGFPTACMEEEALVDKLPEILQGIEQLVYKNIPYQLAAKRHVAKLRNRLGEEHWMLVDWPEVIGKDFLY